MQTIVAPCEIRRKQFRGGAFLAQPLPTGDLAGWTNLPTSKGIAASYPAAVNYRVTDEHGERLAGKFEFKAVFDGTTKIVKPQQVF